MNVNENCKNELSQQESRTEAEIEEDLVDVELDKTKNKDLKLGTKVETFIHWDRIDDKLRTKLV